MACRRGFAGTAIVAAGLVAGVASAATLNGPIAVAVDSSGQIYVANLDGNNVTIYSKQRALVGTITAEIGSPAGVAVATNGNIYVLNSNPVFYYRRPMNHTSGPRRNPKCDSTLSGTALDERPDIVLAVAERTVRFPPAAAALLTSLP